MTTRTKIICTIGPAVNSVEKMLELIDAGMNVARLNFSHSNHDGHREVINKLKEARDISGKPLAILLDTKGPEVRIGQLKEETVSLKRGQKLKLKPDQCGCPEFCVPITPGSVIANIEKGMKVLFNDGHISTHVLSTSEGSVEVEVENDGDIQSRKGVNIPNAVLGLPAMTEQDIEDIKFGCQEDVDIVAASFIRSPEHVLAIKRLLYDQGKSDILVIAKIENTEGVQNFDGILQAADGIMIARGDMGVELPLSDVPPLQKMMIRKCYLEGKPSVTATQMLESMMSNPRPTRAEASDVANAIYDSTSAVMLSGETAAGKYPIETVRVMKQIIRAAEADFDYSIFSARHSNKVYHDVPSSVTLATVKTAYSSHAKVIFIFTSSGISARLVSRLRPEMPILAMTSRIKSYHQMAFNWGVTPVFDNEGVTSMREAFSVLSEYALSQGVVQYGDLVVLTAGTPFGVAGTTNMMLVESIGDVLVRGEACRGRRVHAKVALLLSPDARHHYEVKGCILVIPQCDDRYLPFLKNAAGVILQNQMDDRDSERYASVVAKTLDIPVITQADRACSILHEGQLVTLDSEQGLVFKGIVENENDRNVE
ncbi:Pyruvate kinase [Chlamydiales bacterium SCGC AG-110-M15]|nr:Pyruvate kinase [Chlamydiales bacterium SCGC AG-110-M15]